MKKLAFISDLIFTFCVSFLFTICFFRFLRVGIFLALLLSAVCGALTTCAIAALLNARRKKFFLKKSDAEAKDKLLTHLALLSDEDATDHFLRYFQTEQPNERPTRREVLQISVGANLFFLKFRFAPVNADDVADVFRAQTAQTKILLCTAIEPQAKALCEKLNIGTRTGDEIYSALKKANVLPQVYLGANQKKERKFKLKLWLAKTNARRFLTSAALILLLSFLTPFFYYYLILGTVLLLAAVFIRIFGYDAPTQ